MSFFLAPEPVQGMDCTSEAGNAAGATSASALNPMTAMDATADTGTATAMDTAAASAFVNLPRRHLTDSPNAPDSRRAARYRPSLADPDVSALPASVAPLSVREPAKGASSGAPFSSAASPSFGLGAPEDPFPWPQPWRELWVRTRPAPLVWTYSDLGRDLTAGTGQTEESRQRSALLKQIIGELHLPRGSSAFWPVHMEDKESAGPEDPHDPAESPTEAECFRAGIQLLHPNAIIFFGSDALGASGFPTALQRPFTQDILQGRLVLLLPDFAQLIASAALCSRTSAFLRSALSALPGILSH